MPYSPFIQDAIRKRRLTCFPIRIIGIDLLAKLNEETELLALSRPYKELPSLLHINVLETSDENSICGSVNSKPEMFVLTPDSTHREGREVVG